MSSAKTAQVLLLLEAHLADVVDAIVRGPE